MIIFIRFFVLIIVLFAFTLTAQPKPEETVILDNFEDNWGDKPGQNNFGAVKGYFEYGKNNVQLGGGFWYTFADNGSAVMNGGATDTIFYENISKFIERENENSYMNVWLKTAQSSTQHPYAGVGCSLSGTGAGDTHDFSNLTSLKMKVKGQGKVSLRMETKDIADAFDWGFYQYEINLTSEWTEITIPVSSLKPPSYSEPALKGWTWDHGKKKVVKLSFQVKDSLDANLLVDDITFEGIKYMNVTPIGCNHKKGPVFNPITIKTDKNAFHFILKGTDYVQFTVFDLKGKSVIKLIDGRIKKGSYTISWNKKNKYGIRAAKGSYFANIKIGLQSQWKKITVCE